jgi:phenylalanyl-tRNA synthetase alpha chain
MMSTAQLSDILEDALHRLEMVGDLQALEGWRVAVLGRQGSLNAVLRGIASLPKDERQQAGQAANDAKRRLEAAYEAARARLQTAALGTQLGTERIDVTLPGRPLELGRLHPSTQILRQIYAIFADMGFQVYLSRQVELDEYNFQLLNIPDDHPARDMQDSLYIDQRASAGTEGQSQGRLRMLRTHTSPGQIHAMREYAPQPVRIILPGMVYRHEKPIPTKDVMFNQVEGLAVGRHVTMADLKGTLTNFARRMFGPDRAVRFRASYFPFTEPSAETDVSCMLCTGSGCRVCKYTGWIEILGCGMVHPQVLRNGGYDPDVYSGFAFGLGPERITMLKHGIDDIRHFWANDLRFLACF